MVSLLTVVHSQCHQSQQPQTSATSCSGSEHAADLLESQLPRLRTVTQRKIHYQNASNQIVYLLHAHAEEHAHGCMQQGHDASSKEETFR